MWQDIANWFVHKVKTSQDWEVYYRIGLSYNKLMMKFGVELK